MSNLVYHLGCVFRPTNVEHYLKVNPMAIRVEKMRGGFRPMDLKTWGGNLPIKPFKEMS